MERRRITLCCLAWCFRLLCKKSTSSSVDGFSWLLRPWITYPAPEKSRSQSQNPRCFGVRPDPTRTHVRHSRPTLFFICFTQIVRVTRRVPAGTRTRSGLCNKELYTREAFVAPAAFSMERRAGREAQRPVKPVAPCFLNTCIYIQNIY